MNWFKNLKVGNKLLLSFLLVLVLSIVVGAVSIVEMLSINSSYSDAMDLATARVDSVLKAKDEFNNARMAVRETFYPNNTRADLQTDRATIIEQLDMLEKELDALYLISVEGGDVQKRIEEVKPLIDKYRREMTGVIDGLLAQSVISIDDSAYVDALHKAQEAVNRAGTEYAGRMSDLLAEIPTIVLDVMTKAADDNEAAAWTAIWITVGIIAAMIFIVIFIIAVVPKTITKPLAPLTKFMEKAGTTGDITLSAQDSQTFDTFSRYEDETGHCIKGASAFVKRITEVSEVLDRIAAGDLTVDISLLSNADVMGKAVSKMIDNMNNMFGEINSSSSQVDSGAKQIADGAQALSQGSTEQAASVEQLSSSVAEIASQTQVNADMAEKAHQLSESIRHNAEKGERQMDEMMTAVRDINTASQNISKVIKVIDDIAFQTNILALNAAVEAARAGQHGKGFAVVAEEVRNLAAKSAEAAKETGDMIQNSMEKAELGSRIASETAQSFTEIASGIQESSQLVEEIAKSSKEQAMGISQVNVGIDQVAQVVQQNSATAEESAAASEEMSGQSAMLQELISQFKLKNH